ncbi:MAG: hypothetical protein CM15mV87_280 [Caudoviricetes sp.]|nr:MAG: hypothetical protein CM15mV87_280 [Caudoviricetes sp.]
MTVGCLVDTRSLSMSYMKLNLKKTQIFSCGLITDGMPHLTPMYLRKMVLGIITYIYDNNIL